MASPTKEASDKNTVTTLNHLADKGYTVSKKKAQISQTRVTHVAFIFTEDQRNPSQERKGKKSLAALPLLKLEDSLGVSWGMAWFGRIWIPN